MTGNTLLVDLIIVMAVVMLGYSVSRFILSKIPPPKPKKKNEKKLKGDNDATKEKNENGKQIHS